MRALLELPPNVSDTNPRGIRQWPRERQLRRLHQQGPREGRDKENYACSVMMRTVRDT